MSGPDAGFGRAYEQYQPEILAYCRRRLPAADAQDAAAEVFATAWRRRDDMPRGAETLPWLFGVARRVLSHHWRGTGRRRRLNRRVEGQAWPTARSPEDVVVERADHVRVRAALHRLKPIDREILMLSAWEGLSYAEIGSVLGISLAAVDKRLVRAKKRLARQFDSLTAPRTQASGGGSR